MFITHLGEDALRKLGRGHGIEHADHSPLELDGTLAHRIGAAARGGDARLDGGDAAAVRAEHGHKQRVERLLAQIPQRVGDVMVAAAEGAVRGR